MLSPQGRAAEKCINAREKAVLQARRLGREHRTAQRALDEAHQALERYAQDFEALVASIRPHGVIVADEVVHGSQEHPSELMRLLLPEGITQLTFDPTLPREELEGLVGVLAEHWQDRSGTQVAGDGRLLSSLWSLNLLALGYRVYDPLSANATRLFQRRAALGTNVVDHSPQLAPVANRMGALVEEVLMAEEGRAPSQPFFRQLRRDQRLILESSGWGPLAERSEEFLASDDGTPRRGLLDALPSEDDVRERARLAVEWACAQPEGGARASGHGPLPGRHGGAGAHPQRRAGGERGPGPAP